MASHSNIEQQATIKEVIQTLVSVIEYKSEFFRGHSERVAANCILFSSYLALSRESINNLYFAGLLYDIGMVYIPMEVINKPDKLTEEELAIVKEHPQISVNILSQLRYLKNTLPIIRHHHENFAGDGYPDGLAGDKIPLGARILSVLDSYDAMTSERPHRSALSQEDALEQIRAGSGKTFDPKLVDEFIRFITSRKKTSASQDATTGAKDAGIQSNSAGQTQPAKAAISSSAETQPVKAEVNSVAKAVTDIVLAFKRGIIEVPAFPMVIHKIQNVLRSPDKGLEDVAKIIEQDQVVTLRILSMSNSTHYGGGGNIQTVALALSRIGMKETQNVVSAIAMKSMYTAGNAEIKALMEKLWIHALATAHAARAIVRKIRGTDEDSLFLIGLTHDVGKVLLLNALTKSLFKKGETTSVDMQEVLASIQGVHASFGGALLKKWGFKPELISAVTNHETPDLSANASKTNLVLYLANMLTRRIGYSMYEDQPDTIGHVIEQLGLDEAAVEGLLESIKATVENAIASIGT